MPVGGGHLPAVSPQPHHVLDEPSGCRLTPQKAVAPKSWMGAPKSDQSAHEFEQRSALRAFGQGPVDPADVVVLTIGIVVAPLAPTELVASQQHRRAEREKESGQKVALLPQAPAAYPGVVGWTFGAEVRAVVIVGSILISLPIRGVVFFAIAHQVLKGEAIMACDEIDAGPWPAAPMIEDVARSGNARREIAQLTPVTPPEAPQRIAISVIPLGPSGRKSAELVGVLSDIPRLRDQLDRSQHRILLQRRKKARRGIEGAIRATGKARRQVEAKSIDMHFFDPVAQ